jgi:hypothetical protein
MNPIQATSPANASTPPAAAPPMSAEAASLMPPPAADNIDDAMSAVYVLLAKQQSSDMTSSEADVQTDKKAREKAISDETAARKNEENNESTHGTGFFGSIGKLVKDVGRDALHGRIDKMASDTVSDVKAAVDSPKFWSDLEKGAKDVATVAAVVAGVAATVATAGTAAPLVVAAAVALSAGGFVVSETQCLGKYSAYIGLGMELGGALVSGGGLAATTATSKGAQLVAGLGLASSAATGGADVVAGTAHIENTKFEARVVKAQADETQAKDKVGEETRATKWLLDNLSAAHQAEQDTMSTLQQIVQQHDAGKVALASTMRG